MNPLEQIVNDIAATRITRRTPSFRYYRTHTHAYCWTTEPAWDEKGRKRYASWQARLSKKYITSVRSTRRIHALRKNAKARALQMYQENKK